MYRILWKRAATVIRPPGVLLGPFFFQHSNDCGGAFRFVSCWRENLPKSVTLSNLGLLPAVMTNKPTRLLKPCERRARSRSFPLKMACSYRAFKGGARIQEGDGETVEISSHTVKFRTPTIIETTAEAICVSIPWPVCLDDGAKLQLVVTGAPIWHGPMFEGVRIEKHEFRIRHCRSSAPIATVPVWSATPKALNTAEARYLPVPGSQGNQTQISSPSAR